MKNVKEFLILFFATIVVITGVYVYDYTHKPKTGIIEICGDGDTVIDTLRQESEKCNGRFLINFKDADTLIACLTSDNSLETYYEIFYMCYKD